MFVRCWISLVALVMAVSPLCGEVVLQPQPIRGNGGVAAFRFQVQTAAEDRIRKGKQGLGYTECTEVEGIRNLLLCGSYLQETMNRLFLRASIFAEGAAGQAAQSVSSLDDEGYLRTLILAKGHDLPGEALEAFFNVAEGRLSAQEAEWEAATRVWRNDHQPYVVIGFSVQNVNDYRTITSHEGIHAQYFLNPAFASVADSFWAHDLTREERSRARGILRPMGYDVRNTSLMANECAAYLLQYGAMAIDGRFRSLGEPARQLLQRRYEEAQIPIILLE